jgi:hypothetical protein
VFSSTRVALIELSNCAPSLAVGNFFIKLRPQVVFVSEQRDGDDRATASLISIAIATGRAARQYWPMPFVNKLLNDVVRQENRLAGINRV